MYHESVWGGGEGYAAGDTPLSIAKKSHSPHSPMIIEYLESHKTSDRFEGKETFSFSTEKISFEKKCPSCGRCNDENDEVKREETVREVFDLLTKHFSFVISSASSDLQRDLLISTQTDLISTLRMFYFYSFLNETTEGRERKMEKKRLEEYSELVQCEGSVTEEDTFLIFSNLLLNEEVLKIDHNEEALFPLFRSFDIKTLSTIRRPIIKDTLLHLTCASGYVHLSLFLLQNGFECLVSSDGKYPLHCFLESKIHESFQKGNRKRESDKTVDKDTEYHDLYMEFFRRGVDPSYVLPQRGVLDLNGGDTFLHFAVESGSYCLIRILLDFHVDIFQKNVAGLSALENAILLDEKGKRSVELLLRSLDRDELEEEGKKCLQYGLEETKQKYFCFLYFCFHFCLFFHFPLYLFYFFCFLFFVLFLLKDF